MQIFNSPKLVETKKPEQSSKNKFYIGIDGMRSSARHQYHFIANDTPANNTIGTPAKRSSNYNASINLGYRLNFNKFFIAPEIFYDNLQSSTEDFFIQGDPINLNYRYGAKLNLGYNIFSKFNLFTTIGLTNISYKTKFISDLEYYKSSSSSKIAPIYGVGASYDFTKNWSIKGSYEQQQFNIRYAFEGLRSSVMLKTTKLGFAYKF